MAACGAAPLLLQRLTSATRVLLPKPMHLCVSTHGQVKTCVAGLSSPQVQSLLNPLRLRKASICLRTAMWYKCLCLLGELDEIPPLSHHTKGEMQGGICFLACDVNADASHLQLRSDIFPSFLCRVQYECLCSATISLPLSLSRHTKGERRCTVQASLLVM